VGKLLHHAGMRTGIWWRDRKLAREHARAMRRVDGLMRRRGGW
jgi:hypothetical protein